jgi:hypothetical protein
MSYGWQRQQEAAEPLVAASIFGDRSGGVLRPRRRAAGVY